MVVDITVLGTSSQFPTRDRNHTSFFLRFDKFKALFDCGEGTQRQMRKMKLSPHHLNALFITHWHGDHTLGIGGILQSLSATNRKETLQVYGPVGSEERVNHIIETYYFNKTFDLEVVELNPSSVEVILETSDFKITTFPLKHGIPTIGYSFITKPVRKINLDYTKQFGLEEDPLLGKLQKGETIEYEGETITPEDGTYWKEGKKVSFVLDTEYFTDLNEFVENSDLLISEGTYSSKDEERCKEFNHLSVTEAARVAKDSNSELLLLTHVSQRYTNLTRLEAEAQEIFPNTHYAEDFEELNLKGS